MNSGAHKRGARFDDPLSYLSRAINRAYSAWLRMTYPFASVGRNLYVQYPCVLSKFVAHRIQLGSSVVIRKDAWLNVPMESDSELNIVIDDNCLIGARNIISAKNRIHIERDVMMATGVLIQDHHHAYEDVNLPIRDQGCTPGGTIRIEQGCWIGQGAAIICNEGELVIGRNSVIGVNSLVTKSAPPNSVILGNPGRLARQFDPVKEAWSGGGAGRAVTSETMR
jgi:acetyltransferase-like isoleucine patch superfamily enzyme